MVQYSTDCANFQGFTVGISETMVFWFPTACTCRKSNWKPTCSFRMFSDNFTLYSIWHSMSGRFTVKVCLNMIWSLVQGGGGFIMCHIVPSSELHKFSECTFVQYWHRVRWNLRDIHLSSFVFSRFRHTYFIICVRRNFQLPALNVKSQQFSAYKIYL
jgi:hypothetical protein